MPLILAAAAACTLIAHDGDTVRCGAERIRIANIDAPELRGSPACIGYKAQTRWCDYGLGIKSRDALRAFLAKGRPVINRSGIDRFGRTLATVSVNGWDAGEFLISRGLARPWIK